MASKSGSDIQILVDVLGGGSISGESGKRIQHQIEQIINRVNKSDAVKLRIKNVVIDPMATASAQAAINAANISIAIGTITVSQQAIASLQTSISGAMVNQTLDSITIDQSCLQKMADDIKQKIETMPAIEVPWKWKANNNNPPGPGPRNPNNGGGLATATRRTVAVSRELVKADEGSSRQAELKEQHDRLRAERDALREEQANSSGRTERELQTEANSTLQVMNAVQQLRLAEAAREDQLNRTGAAAQISYNKVADSVHKYWTKTQDVIAKNPELYHQMQSLHTRLMSGIFEGTAKDAQAEFTRIRREIGRTDTDFETLGQKITRVFKDKFGYAVMAAAADAARRSIHQLYTNVVELDDAMAQMKIVTGASTKALKEYSEGAADAAKATGRTMTEIMASSTEYARLGYNLEESLRLSETTAKLSNVADIDTAEATTAMTSILKGFRLEAKDAEMVGDMMTKVANEYAIDAGELGAALERGGASLAAANNTLAESMALMAAGNAAIQNAETVGTAFKTTSMRIRGTSVEELEEAGLATDGLIESTAKLQSQIKALSGVDIMLDADTYKSTYQIMLEIAQVWDDLSDINQAALLEALAGKRNSQVLMSVIQNLDDLTGSYEAAQNAAGTMEKANAIAMDTITGKTKALSASWQELSGNLLDSDIVKALMDLARAVVESFNWIITAGDGVGGTFISITAAVSGFITMLPALIGGIVKVKDAIKELQAIGFASKTGGTFLGVLTSPHIMLAATALIALGTAATYAYRQYKKLNPTLEELKEKTADFQSELEDLQQALDENRQRIVEIESLKATGNATLADEDELRRLREENRLLAAQLKLKQDGLNDNLKEEQTQAFEKARDFFNKSNSQWIVSNNETGGYVKETTDADAVLVKLAEYQQSYDELIAATKTGDEKAIAAAKARLDVLRSQLEESLTTINAIKSSLDTTDPAASAYADQLQHMVDKISVGVGSMSVSDLIHDVIQRDEKAYNAIMALASKGELSESALVELYKTNDSVRSVLDYLASEGSISLGNLEPIAKELNQITTIAGKTATPLSAMIDDVQDKLDVLYDAQDEMAEVGMLSLETIQKLSNDSTLKSYLIQTANGYKLATGAVDHFKSSQIALYSTTLNEAQLAAKNVISQQTSMAASVALTTDEYIRQMEAIIAEERLAQSLSTVTKTSSKTGKKGSLSTGLYYEDPREVSVTATSDLAEWDTILKNLKAAKADEEQIRAVLGSYSATKAAEGDDKYKETIDLKLRQLKHRLEMNAITSGQYYDELENILNVYYKDSVDHQKKYAEEIMDIEEEIFNGRRELLSDWMNDQQKAAEMYGDAGQLTAQLAIHRGILAEIQKAIDASYAYGLDETSDYVQELRQQAKETSQEILELTKSAFDDFISYADDFDLWNDLDISKVETLEQKLKEIDKLLEDGTLSWKEYIQAHNEAAKDLYDTQKESIETIIDLTMEMIQQEKDDEVEALEDQLEMYEKIIEKKKKMLEKTKDEADHEKEVAELVEDIAELQQKISRLDLDDSREAAAKKQELEKELHEKNKELADLQNDYILDQTIETLDDSLDAKEESIEAETKAIEESIDTWVKKYKLAIERIDDDWDGLYDDLMDYQEEYRDSIDGVDSLQTAWENVESTIESVKATMSGLTGIEDVYENIGNNAINPSTSGSIAANGKSVVMDMYQNSLSALRDPSNWRSYNDDNMQIAEQYNASASSDQKLFYNSADGTWRIGSTNGALAYKHFGIANDGVARGPVASTMISSEPSGTVKYGDKNNYVKWVQTLLNASIGANLGVDGQFGSATLAAVKQFQAEHGLNNDGVVGTSTIRHLRAYHTGGVVDGTGAINDEEVFAILKRGELVFNDEQKSQLKKILHGMFSMIGAFANFGTSAMKFPATLSPTVGDTFAPKFEINIAHNGSMSDQDARRYGDAIGDAALEKLRVAFSKRGIR